MRCALLGISLLSLAAVARADELVAPKQLDHTAAIYPDGATGDAVVELELLIGSNGTVESIKVVVGDPPFDEAARAAAAHWTFAPATRNGIPVRARIRAKVTFEAPKKQAPAPPTAGAPAASVAAPSATSTPDAPVIVLVNEEREELGSTHIPRTETRFVPGAFADPFRVVETLPGVAPLLSGIPYFYVRGAPPGDVGYSIDGIRVPLLFHVGAGPSVIAPALVDRVDLYPSAYPTAFGRYVGGLMAGETTAPSDEPRAEIQARIFDAGAFVEQPFDGGTTNVMVGGRYGYTGFIVSKVAPDYSLGYWDYQARIAHRFGTADTLSVFGFGAYDRLRNEALGRSVLDVQFHRVDLRWDHHEENTRARVALTFDYDHGQNAEDRLNGAESDYTSRGARLRGSIDHHFDKVVRLRAGADLGLERFTSDLLRVATFSRSYDPRSDLLSGGWMDLVVRPARGVEIVPGFRLDILRARDETHVLADPRLAVRFRLWHGVSLVSAMGVSHQVPTVTIPVPGRAQGGLEGSVQEAYQVSEALEVALPSQVFAKATLFASRIHVPAFGTAADNQGLELFLRRDFTKELGFLVSYTLARTGRTGSLTGLSEFDRTHVLSVVAGYDFGGGVRLGLRTFFESGRPYATHCPVPGCAPGSMPSGDAPWPYLVTGRLPAFFRLDGRLEKRWTSGRGRWMAATLEWFNATLSTEPDHVEWDPVLGQRLVRRSALTLPSIGIEAGY